MKLYVRLKDDAGIPLEVETLGEFDDVPESGFCYVLGVEGLREHLNNDTFSAFAESKGCPQLASQPARMRSKLPVIAQSTVEVIVGFFHQVYKKHRSEAIVLLYYSAKLNEYRLLIPHQEVDVWVPGTSGGNGYVVAGQWLDLKYEVPPTPVALLDDGFKLVGTVHSHGAHAAYHSATDDYDEQDRNGLHITIGNLNKATAKNQNPKKGGWGAVVTFSCSFMVNGNRHKLDTPEVMEAFQKIRTPPAHWIGRVRKGEKKKPATTSYTSPYTQPYIPPGASYVPPTGNVYSDTNLPIAVDKETEGELVIVGDEDANCYGEYDGDHTECQKCPDAVDCMILKNTMTTQQPA